MTDGRAPHHPLQWWAFLIPAVAVALMAVALVAPIGTALALACGAALVGAVIAAVHHAEVIAHRIGEPYGTLVLSISITIIEVALIVSIMLAEGEEKATLARDTIFAVIMITTNGLAGLSLLIGALRHREQSFHVIGSNAILATLMALTALTLVLPMFTTSSAGPTYTRSQLSFAAIASLLLWSMFVFVQAVRHRDYFLPVGLEEDAHAPRPTTRAALADRLQTSLNLSLGSALASIGLTIPAVAFSSLLMGTTLVLGLAPKELALLVLTFVVASVTLVAGRTHLLQGVVHLVIFGAFIFFALVP